MSCYCLDILGTDNDLVYKYIEDEVDKELLNIAINKLSRREKKIMELRFGLKDGTEKTQKKWRICSGSPNLIFQGWRKEL